MKKRETSRHKAALEKGKFIRHSIFGAEDGLISTLGFLSGIAGANLAGFTIIIAGVAEIFAAALSMGIGTYLSSKSQTELIKRKIELEKEEINKFPKLERKEVEKIYRKKGFKGQELKKIVNKIISNKNLFLEEILVEELGIIPKNFENPLKSAFVMFFTFIVLALIPLLPYLFLPITNAIIASIILTTLTLFLIGAIKSKLTKRNWFYSGLEMMSLGLLAAVVTYYTGNIISSII